MFEDYNIWDDFFITVRSLNDWIKFSIIAGFYGTILGSIYLFRRPRDKPKSEPPPVQPPYQPPSFNLQLPDLREEKLMITHLSSEEKTKGHSEMPETPETHIEAPETPETSETHVEAPETPETSETHIEAPETPETPETHIEAPETPESPQISDRKQ